MLSRLKLFNFLFTKKTCYQHLEANVLEARNIDCLKKAMGWTKDPIISDSLLHEFHYLEDLNERRLRDAEVIATACCNGNPKIILEIGTSHGKTTALMSQNAPHANIYTVNIPPEEINEGGKNVTFAPSVDEIGSYYRKTECSNIKQILANTKNWEPDFGPIDVAFIDGCHDADFVYNDTRKILSKCRPGSLIMWHDFNPKLANVFKWIGNVCEGVDRLYKKGLLHGKILCLQDSWIGLYKVPNK